ncbi:MAG TPA: DUF3795 domain-containing protein [bacterium]|nr:DUF3795 domain-containing protein [bacterium]
MTDYKELTAPCGLDCFNCPLYSENATDEIIRMMVDKFGMSESALPCRGCRAVKGKVIGLPGCATFNCAAEKGHEFCCDCGEFPCSKLQPMVDGCDRYPHNMKVFNLCRIKNAGLEKWAEEESLDIRKKYYRGRFVIGAGPVLDL